MSMLEGQKSMGVPSLMRGKGRHKVQARHGAQDRQVSRWSC